MSASEAFAEQQYQCKEGQTDIKPCRQMRTKDCTLMYPEQYTAHLYTWSNVVDKRVATLKVDWIIVGVYDTSHRAIVSYKCAVG